jgi:hypothetical protein
MSQHTRLYGETQREILQLLGYSSFNLMTRPNRYLPPPFGKKISPEVRAKPSADDETNPDEDT